MHITDPSRASTPTQKPSTTPLPTNPRSLTKRVFVYKSGLGYVGVGIVTGAMIPAREAKVKVNGELQPLLDQPECDRLREDALSDDPDVTEMVVPVEWIATCSDEEAVPWKGHFHSSITVCKLRDEHTITTVEQALGLVT